MDCSIDAGIFFFFDGLDLAKRPTIADAIDHGNLELDSSLRESPDDAYRKAGRERAEQPPFQQGRDEVHTRHELVGATAALGEVRDTVAVSEGRQLCVATQTIRVDCRARRHRFSDEAGQATSRDVLDLAEPNSPGGPTSLLCGYGDDGLGLDHAGVGHRASAGHLFRRQKVLCV